MTEKTLTTENIKPALDALRGELAPWPVVAKKQDRLNTAQLNAANSGITSSLVAQIIANTTAIRALESAITGTGLRALVVSSLPAVGTTGILYIVPVTTYDPDTDADVVNYSNEYIWIPVEGGTASEGHYEQVGQTGIVINNGQLTITVNGTSVGTFTANQSGDTTAAITVPTNADYVDRTTDQTVAGVKTFSSTINGTAAKAIADEDGTSIKTGYVNVAGNQTVSGDKSWTGSNTFNSILPNATNTYSLGSSSYQWSSVYAQTYYYNGTAWGLDKGNEWSNTNRFLTAIALKNTELEIGVAPSTSHKSRTFYFTDKNNSTLASIIARTNPSGSSYLTLDAGNFYKDGVMDSTGSKTTGSLFIGTTTEGKAFCSSKADLYPETNNTYTLGTSTNQWKSVYSQTYYYNGTAWGLDKENTWTQNQIISSSNDRCYFVKDTVYELGQTYSNGEHLGGMQIQDKNGSVVGLLDIVDRNYGNTEMRIRVQQRFDPNSNNRSTSGNILYNEFILGITSTKTNYIGCNADLWGGNTYSLGTSTNQWKSVYAQTYYYNGTAWGLDKANTWSQNQSVVNAVTPKFILQDTRNDRTYSASATLSGGVMRWECDDKDGAPLSRISTTLRSDKVVQLQLAIFNEDSTGTEFDRTIRFAVGNTGSAVYYPEQTGNVDLGDSSHKWKTLNGVNPGALSLPNGNAQDTSWIGDLIIKDGSDYNLKTFTLNGWITINIPNTAGNLVVVNNGCGQIITNEAKGITGSNCSVFIPVVANVQVSILLVLQTGESVKTAIFTPCLGNV